jgi:mannose-6-phosphate isomerase-like protein (cupin superfamily)
LTAIDCWMLDGWLAATLPVPVALARAAVAVAGCWLCLLAVHPPLSATCLQPSSMCSIIGAAARVVDAGGFTIDELAGNVATKDDQLSIAYVKAAAGTAEPWLTLHYDEWICVRSGMAVFSQEGLPDIEASAGQTIHLPPGTRFQPSFPVDTEYIPVCLPAFRPDRCVREDVTDEGAAVAAKLNELHDQDTTAATPEEAAVAAPKEEAPEVLFHMTTVDEWTAAQTKGVYYPKTFEADGHCERHPAAVFIAPHPRFHLCATHWRCDVCRHPRDGRAFAPSDDGQSLLSGCARGVGVPAVHAHGSARRGHFREGRGGSTCG